MLEAQGGPVVKIVPYNRQAQAQGKKYSLKLHALRHSLR
jgi:hypothetical protein